MEYNKLKYQVQKQNGRVTNLSETMTQGDFPLYKETGEECLESYQNRPLMGIVQASELSNAFFSEANFQRLQNQMRYRVYKESDENFIVDEQDKTQLVIIMRAVYLQNGLNDPTQSIAQQVQSLNHTVGNYAVPNIISKAKQHLGYIQELETTVVPLPLLLNVSSAGTRTLRSITSTF